MRINMPEKMRVPLVVAAVIFGLSVFFIFDPAYNIFPRCPFYMLTGWKCPGCGSQRALYQLLHLNLGEAFRYNAFFLLVIPVLVFLLVSEFYGDRCPKLHAFARKPAVAWTLLAAVALWTILRNVFNC